MALSPDPNLPSEMQGGYLKEIMLDGSCDEKFLCNFCGKILREPVQSYCGHRFCRSCVESQISSGKELRCTQCLNESQGQEDNDEEISLIDKDKSHCTTECVKRQVFCDTCGNDMVYEELQKHRNTCKDRMVDCPVTGCTAGVIEHSQLAQHFKQPNHFSWMIIQLTMLQQQIEQVKRHLHQSYETLDGNLRANCTSMEDKIAALQQQVSELIVRTDSSSLAVSDSAVDLKIGQSVERQTQNIHERLNIKVDTLEGIASALRRELGKAITAIEKLEHQRREMKEILDQNVAKIQLLERKLALKDISLAEMNLKVQAMETATFDGVLIWKVTDFSKKQSEAQQGRSINIYSPPFYSSCHGYKMCACMYPNGDGMGKGSHLSVFFVVMRGNYDALQKWPFAQCVSFCLLNQMGSEHVIDSFRADSQSSSFKCPVTDMNVASGCPQFIRFDILMNPTNGFLKDDTLFLKVTVNTNDLVDPAHMKDSKGKLK